MNNHQKLMDSIYKYQKRIYDPSRKFILPGRDKMLKMLNLKGTETILEIGCGTSRNLIKIARRHPETTLVGVDISGEMLTIAKQKCNSLTNIHLHHSSAEDFNFKNIHFDIAFFSYSLTMINHWKKVIDNVIEGAKPGCIIFIVDFYDKNAFPAWLRILINKWLSLFHVSYEKELIDHLNDKAKKQLIQFILSPLLGGYSYIAKIVKE